MLENHSFDIVGTSIGTERAHSEFGFHGIILLRGIEDGSSKSRIHQKASFPLQRSAACLNAASTRCTKGSSLSLKVRKIWNGLPVADGTILGSEPVMVCEISSPIK